MVLDCQYDIGDKGQGQIYILSVAMNENIALLFNYIKIIHKWMIRN